MTSRKRQPGTRLCWATLLFLLTIAPSIGWGQATAPLPPAAQEAFDKGITAAREQGYLVAIRYLQDARKLAPQAPQIYRSLGAVEAKIPGRELRAIAWYGAYLAAFPNAPDAAEVIKEIGRLEVKSQIYISGLIKSVQDAASQMSGDNESGDKSRNLKDVADLWLESGDIASAEKTTELIRFAHFKSLALIDIAEAKIRAGDLAGAKITFASALKCADLIAAEPSFGIQSSATTKSRRQAGIAIAQAKSGDIAGAQKTADLIKDVHKAYAQRDIAEAQAKGGDIAGALKTADLIQDADLKKQAQEAIAEAQTKASNTYATNPTRQSTSAPPVQSVITASDWLKKLDDGDKSNDCPLNTGPFLDLAGYLKSLPPSNDPSTVFRPLHEIARKIVTAQNVITGILKQQAKP